LKGIEIKSSDTKIDIKQMIDPITFKQGKGNYGLERKKKRNGN